MERLPSIAGYMERKKHPSFYLERMRLLLYTLGSPERGLEYIHIGGTAGKGSVTLLLHNMWLFSGKKVSAFISPHITTPIERILINGRPISVNDFMWAWKKIKPAIQHVKKTHGEIYAPSYFEAHFAMSLLLFHKKHIKHAILEVGCGGEFDATNTIPAPLATVITNIYLDHTQLLGRTRRAIAETKAGIIKTGTHVFTGESDPHIRTIIQRRAKRKKAKYTYIKIPKNTYRISKDMMLWRHAHLGKLSTHLMGAHQLHNIELAVAVAKFLHLPSSAIKKGIAQTRIPARSEFMQKHPAIFIDGAHNPAKMRALVELLRKMPYTRIHGVVGIGGNKPAAQMLRILLPKLSDCIFTRASLNLPKPASARKLLHTAKTLSSKPVFAISNPRTAIKRALKKSAKDDLILVTGSLYLSGEVRAQWISESSVCRTRNLFYA